MGLGGLDFVAFADGRDSVVYPSCWVVSIRTKVPDNGSCCYIVGLEVSKDCRFTVLVGTN